MCRDSGGCVVGWLSEKNEHNEVFYDLMGPDRLNLGCALNHEPGWTNLDINPAVKPDVVADLEAPPLPLADESFDFILGSHVFEHVRNFVPLVSDLWRILRPGGLLVSVTPYYMSEIAVAEPLHIRYFSEVTWPMMCRSAHESVGTAGNGASQGYTFHEWEILRTIMVPLKDWNKLLPGIPLEVAHRHFWNIIQEIIVVLRKPS